MLFLEFPCFINQKTTKNNRIFQEYTATDPDPNNLLSPALAGPPYIDYNKYDCCCNPWSNQIHNSNQIENPVTFEICEVCPTPPVVTTTVDPICTIVLTCDDYKACESCCDHIWQGDPPTLYP